MVELIASAPTCRADLPGSGRSARVAELLAVRSALENSMASYPWTRTGFTASRFLNRCRDGHATFVLMDAFFDLVAKCDSAYERDVLIERGRCVFHYWPAEAHDAIARRIARRIAAPANAYNTVSA